MLKSTASVCVWLGSKCKKAITFIRSVSSVIMHGKSQVPQKCKQIATAFSENSAPCPATLITWHEAKLHRTWGPKTAIDGFVIDRTAG